MEAPKRIFANKSYNWFLDTGSLRRKLGRVQYIRADLVEKLIGYARHDPMCNSVGKWAGSGIPPCTCGLTDLIREVLE